MGRPGGEKEGQNPHPRAPARDSAGSRQSALGIRRVSIEALKWALDIGEELDLEPPRRLVLIMLGNSADPAGGHLFPSHKYISRRTGLAYSTVREHIAALQQAKLLIKEPRLRDDGGQTSNQYRLAMRQPGLALDDTPLPESSRGGVVASRAPASQPAGGAAHSKVLKQEVSIAEQSPAAQCAQAYRQGIKARYEADYPGSAKLNGIMAALVRELGADPALQVVRAYMASNDPWYAKKTHALEYLKRDAAQIWVTLQQRSGTAERPPEKAQALLGYPDGRENRLQDYPAGDPEQIARRVLRDYASRIPVWKPKNVIVQLGAKRYPFSIEELARI